MLQGVDFQNFSRDTNFAKQMISMIWILFANFADFLGVLRSKKLLTAKIAKIAKKGREVREGISYRTLPILSTGQYPKTALP